MADRIGQQLGNYRLKSLLGHGGFAEVYLGEHIFLKTQAAIKVLLAPICPMSGLKHFKSRKIEPLIISMTRFAFAEYARRHSEYKVRASCPPLVSP